MECLNVSRYLFLHLFAARACFMFGVGKRTRRKSLKSFKENFTLEKVFSLFHTLCVGPMGAFFTSCISKVQGFLAALIAH